MEIHENIPLAPYTTFGIGGPARWLLHAASENDLTEAVTFARAKGVSLFVLGGGSNLLVSDAGFPGVVVHVANRGIREEPDGESSVFTVAAGEDWDGLVGTTVAQSFAGIECMAGIPGTVGGTPVQNVGAYGQEVASTIVRVRVLDRVTLRMVDFTNANCHFAYRRSIFNTIARERYIVAEVSYRLRRHGAPQLVYKELAEVFAGKPQPALQQVSQAVRALRRNKGMLLVEGDPDCKSAGSFFKNPVVSESHLADLAARVVREGGAAKGEAGAVPHFAAEPGSVKIFAGWLIERAGFPKGFALGNAGISSRHALAVINRGNARAADILALRDQIRKRVLSQFGICLEQEPVYVAAS